LATTALWPRTSITATMTTSEAAAVGTMPTARAVQLANCAASAATAAAAAGCSMETHAANNNTTTEVKEVKTKARVQLPCHRRCRRRRRLLLSLVSASRACWVRSRGMLSETRTATWATWGPCVGFATLAACRRTTLTWTRKSEWSQDSRAKQAKQKQ